MIFHVPSLVYLIRPRTFSAVKEGPDTFGFSDSTEMTFLLKIIDLAVYLTLLKKLEEGILFRYVVILLVIYCCLLILCCRLLMLTRCRAK